MASTPVSDADDWRRTPMGTLIISLASTVSELDGFPQEVAAAAKATTRVRVLNSDFMWSSHFVARPKIFLVLTTPSAVFELSKADSLRVCR
jgi:hypothetical protein